MMKSNRPTDKEIPILGISRLRVGSDGKGIRTLIATQGCLLRCQYCLNPRSWNGEHNPIYLTAEDLYEKIKVDNLYFKATDGGLTFGGGEPLLHAQFIREFITKYCNDWKVAFETSLNVPESNLRQVVDLADFFYVDIKSMNSDIYREYTGMENNQVLNNLKLLVNKCPDKLLVRIPIIPNYNDEADCANSEKMLKDMGVRRTSIFEYKVLQ